MLVETILQCTGVAGLVGYFILAHRGLQYIWPSIVMENGAMFFLISILVMHLVIYGLGNLYYYVFYHLEHPFFEQYKVEKRPWPWNEDPAKWKIQLQKTYNNFALNYVIGAVLAYIETLFGVLTRIDTQSYPPFFEVIWQCLFSMLLEDFGFYWTHRLLHHPKLYSHIHKQHHEYNITISFASEYAHPIEYIIGNAFPVMIGPNLLRRRMHQSTLLIWLSFRIIKTMHGHSGYLFPWEPYPLLPYGTHSDFHSFHHSQNIGNYGSALLLWDNVFNTLTKYSFKQKSSGRKRA